jgi:hypothetical protein
VLDSYECGLLNSSWYCHAPANTIIIFNWQLLCLRLPRYNKSRKKPSPCNVRPGMSYICAPLITNLKPIFLFPIWWLRQFGQIFTSAWDCKWCFRGICPHPSILFSSLLNVKSGWRGTLLGGYSSRVMCYIFTEESTVYDIVEKIKYTTLRRFNARRFPDVWIV